MNAEEKTVREIFIIAKKQQDKIQELLDKMTTILQDLPSKIATGIVLQIRNDVNQVINEAKQAIVMDVKKMREELAQSSEDLRKRGNEQVETMREVMEHNTKEWQDKQNKSRSNILFSIYASVVIVMVMLVLGGYGLHIRRQTLEKDINRLEGEKARLEKILIAS